MRLCSHRFLGLKMGRVGFLRGHEVSQSARVVLGLEDKPRSTCDAERRIRGSLYIRVRIANIGASPVAQVD